MPDTISVQEAAGLICAEPAPVLLLDACALLDILRVASSRENSPPARTILAANEILARSNSRDRRLWLLGAAIVEVEWNDNAQNVVAEIARHVRQVDRSIDRLLTAVREIPSIAANISSSEMRGLAAAAPAPQFEPLDLPTKLFEIAKSVVESALWLAANEQILAAANARSMQGLKPADVGKRERPDCQIIETYFALCRELRARGYVETCVFVSSNKADFFGEGAPMRSHEHLAGTCSGVGLHFTQELSHAISILYSAPGTPSSAI
jgi:hypothetical protein